MSSTNEYVPGVCNIGPAEIRRRMTAGWFGLGATLLVWAACILLRVPQAWRLLLFFPAAGAAVGFLQAAMHFCAAYGLLGVFNVAAAAGKTDTIEQAEFRRTDRNKAFQIILLSALIGLAAAATGFFLLPPG